MTLDLQGCAVTRPPPDFWGGTQTQKALAIAAPEVTANSGAGGWLSPVLPGTYFHLENTVCGLLDTRVCVCLCTWQAADLLSEQTWECAEGI